MVAKNTDNIQALWDDITALNPQERARECEQVEKQQPEIVKFLHEELDGYDAVYSGHNLAWLVLTFQSLLADAGGKKKPPKIRLKDLQLKIDQNESKIGPDDVDEFCENFNSGLLKFLVDQIHHIEPKSHRKTSDMTDEEEEFGEEEGIDHDMDDFKPEEEGDEDYLMFREMYEEHDEHAITDEELEMDQEAKYTLFLVFKSVIDTATEALA